MTQALSTHRDHTATADRVLDGLWQAQRSVRMMAQGLAPGHEAAGLGMGGLREAVSQSTISRKDVILAERVLSYIRMGVAPAREKCLDAERQIEVAIQAHCQRQLEKEPGDADLQALKQAKRLVRTMSAGIVPNPQDASAALKTLQAVSAQTNLAQESSIDTAIQVLSALRMGMLPTAQRCNSAEQQIDKLMKAYVQAELDDEDEADSAEGYRTSERMR